MTLELTETGTGAGMACGVVIEPGKAVLEMRPRPETAPDGWVLVDIKAVGLCGTDYHILQGNQPFLNYPRLIGHELSGTVAEDTGEWSRGDLAVINPYVSCGHCRACGKGKPNCCSRIEVFGVHRDGGLCARLAVPEENLYPAKGLTPIQAAMVEFLAIGAHAVRRACLSSEDRVMVTGAGPIGIGTALFARLAGAEVHLQDVSMARLEAVARPFGFDRLHLAGSGILDGPLVDGFDAVFDATGSARAIEAGFDLLAHGSRYVLVSVVKDRISFADPEFHKRETQIIGSRNATRQDFEAVMEAIRENRFDIDALCTETIPISGFATRFPELAADRGNLIKAVVTI